MVLCINRAYGVIATLLVALFPIIAQLTIEDLQMVKSALWDVREKWKDLGVELSVTQTTLDSINITQRGDSGSCLREILAVWLKISGAGGTPRTWSSIIAALKEVEEMTVAKSIEYQLGASEVPIKSGELKHIIMDYCTMQI